MSNFHPAVYAALALGMVVGRLFKKDIRLKFDNDDEVINKSPNIPESTDKKVESQQPKEDNVESNVKTTENKTNEREPDQ